MKELEFTKAHGIGNDFIIIDCLRGNLGDTNLARLAVRLCDRNFGIGGDGLILILPSERADFRMRTINSDGSEAEMCGNGIRCLARYLFDRGLAGESVAVETLAGVKPIGIVRGEGCGVGFTVDMGVPRLEAEEIPVSGFDGRVISRPLEVDGTQFSITCVSMGNPHCVILAGSNGAPVDRSTLESLGPKIENHPAFPSRTNVEFARVVSDHELQVDVWERGAGITLACGTGACASVVAGVLNGKVGRKATVYLTGGDLLVDWREDGAVYMTGPAEEVFTGSIGV
ncbi:MAG TPA: diaminopimelate epimerase [Armatimonadota bacterium]|nr:diaminopimelate epimerase [Armatimonadota bacterium]